MNQPVCGFSLVKSKPVCCCTTRRNNEACKWKYLHIFYVFSWRLHNYLLGVPFVAVMLYIDVTECIVYMFLAMPF